MPLPATWLRIRASTRVKPRRWACSMKFCRRCSGDLGRQFALPPVVPVTKKIKGENQAESDHHCSCDHRSQPLVAPSRAVELNLVEDHGKTLVHRPYASNGTRVSKRIRAIAFISAPPQKRFIAIIKTGQRVYLFLYNSAILEKYSVILATKPLCRRPNRIKKGKGQPHP